MLKNMFVLVALTCANFSYAGCFDNLTTTTSAYSKIRGFYINPDNNGDAQVHYVILDKNNCTAASSGDVTVTATTKDYYYLSFKSSDETLYSTLLSAQARDVELEFRLAPPEGTSTSNSIAYVISPARANNQ